MQASKNAKLYGRKRTLGECIAMVGAKVLRLLLEGISARAHAIIGTQPRKEDR